MERLRVGPQNRVLHTADSGVLGEIAARFDLLIGDGQFFQMQHAFDARIHASKLFCARVMAGIGKDRARASAAIWPVGARLAGREILQFQAPNALELW